MGERFLGLAFSVQLGCPSGFPHGEFHRSFHHGSIVIDVCKLFQLSGSFFIFSSTFFVSVTQRLECFGIERPGFKGHI